MSVVLSADTELRSRTRERTEMELAQSRLVTDDVQRLAGFYAGLLGVPVTLNEYYVELPAGPVTVGFSRRTFTEYRLGPACCPPSAHRRDSILDFQTENVDAEYERIAALGATVVMPPTTQPWGSRATIFTDPDGNLINVFARSSA
jgi:predicted enzyme related to lactoylglutathione lyase